MIATLENMQPRVVLYEGPGAERRRCLTKLADAAAIPREVLDALPSPEEIQRKSAEAARRAEEARVARAQATASAS